MSESHRSPLIIGGVGGSGTRVFRAIAEAAGYHMLTAPWPVRTFWRNDYHDNLLMRRFFYPRWLNDYLCKQPDERQLARMGKHCRRLLWLCGPTRYGRGKWGWKNPNTLFFLPLWRQLYPSFIYIHVIRDGRDLAFNTKMDYVNRFNRDWFTPQERALPAYLQKALFWQRCNARVAEWSKSFPADRFLETRFEDLCADSNQQISRLFEFLGAPQTPNRVRATAELVTCPKSLGRWKHEPDAHLSEVEQLIGGELERHGYELGASSASSSIDPDVVRTQSTWPTDNSNP